LLNFNIIEQDEFDDISVFIIRTNKDKNDWKNFKALKNRPFNRENRQLLEAARRNLADREVKIPAYIKKIDLGIVSFLKDREIFGLSYVNTQEDVGLSYSKEEGLTILSDDNTLLL